VTAALLLLSWSLAAACCGGRVIDRGRWQHRSPRHGVLAWQALSFSVILAAALAGVALALPWLPVEGWLNRTLGHVSPAVIAHYKTSLGAWPGVVGLAAVAMALAALGATVARVLLRDRGRRRQQRDLLKLVGRPHPDGFTVIDIDVPLAYCLPGRSGSVVLSSGAVALLTDEERRLVLGHEHRHLSARHHLPLVLAEALDRTFPGIPLFRTALERVRVLVEMAADDTATTARERLVLARALVAMGTGSRPEAALGASDTASVQRVRRLAASPARRSKSGVLVAPAIGIVMTLPVGLAAAPGIEAVTTDCCRLEAAALARP
jgi:hypothetical protein